MKRQVSKFILDCAGYAVLAAGFLGVFYGMVRGGYAPEKYFILFLCVELGAFVLFSIYEAAAVAAASSFVAVAALILGVPYVVTVAAFAAYWILLYLLDVHMEKSEDDYGSNRLLIENTQTASANLASAAARGEELIPELKNGISRYERMSEFSLSLGTTFSLKKISMFIINFTRSVFPEAAVSLLKQSQDSCDRWIYSTQKPLFIENCSRDYRFDTNITREDSSLIACPVFNGNSIQSIIKVVSGEGEFTPADLRFLTLIASLSSIAVENMALFERTEELAITDDLTGLYTHSYFMERLEEETERASVHGEKFVFIMMDIDHFKGFNDLFGHQAGDEVLRRVTSRIRETIRSTDIVGRYGGEEISVILPRTDSKRGHEIAENIRKTVGRERFNFSGKSAGVTITCGISGFPPCNNAREIVNDADGALYEGKRDGRNRVVTGARLK